RRQRLWLHQPSKRGGCLRAFLRNSGWRLSQPARRSASAVRGDQGPEGLASRERSGGLSGKQECPLSERISGISVYFGNTTSRTTGLPLRCRTLCPRLRRCFRRSTDPSVIRVETMSIKPSYLLFTNCSQSRKWPRSSNPSDRDYGPNVTVRIVRRAAPKPSGQGAGVEAESRNPSSRRRYCDLLQRQNRLWR